MTADATHTLPAVSGTPGIWQETIPPCPHTRPAKCLSTITRDDSTTAYGGEAERAELPHPTAGLARGHRHVARRPHGRLRGLPGHGPRPGRCGQASAGPVRHRPQRAVMRWRRCRAGSAVVRGRAVRGCGRGRRRVRVRAGRGEDWPGDSPCGSGAGRGGCRRRPGVGGCQGAGEGPRPRGEYATSATPSGAGGGEDLPLRAAGPWRVLALQRGDPGLDRAAVAAPASDRQMWRPLPSATSSAMAPIVSSIGAAGSRRCRWRFRQCPRHSHASTRPARRRAEYTYVPDYLPDHGRSVHYDTSPGAVC